jgi:endonuclease/exonuclease/phosphatase family metal-dependent hydrolase
VKYILLLLLISISYTREFKVASYNVENLFDDVVNGSEYDEYIIGRHNWSRHMVEIKLNNISEVLCELDADIVGLQEIENEAILLRLQKRLKRVGCPYRYRAITTQKRKVAINVALLSRYPILSKREIKVNYSPYDRNILETKIGIDGYTLTIFVNHWKAKSRNGKESRRVNYAKALMERVSKLSKGREYLILGDMNSNYDEYRVIDDRLNDTRGKTAINHILNSIIDDKMVSKEDIISLDKKLHYNLWLELPPLYRWSHNYYGRKGAIDHILLPYRLFDGKGIDYINGSFGVLRDRFLFTKERWIYSWQYSHSRHLGGGYSDHLPIYASFDTKPYRADQVIEAKSEDIETLYDIDRLTHPIELKGATLILKRGDSGIIKQRAKGRAIYLYKTARELEEGKRYDIVVGQIANYKGLKEIIEIDSIKELKSIDIDDYYLHQELLRIDDPTLQNQIFIDIVGVYRDGYLYRDDQKIPIYFKKRRSKPNDGDRVVLKYAHLGEYKTPQLIIYSSDDFDIMR